MWCAGFLSREETGVCILLIVLIPGLLQLIPFVALAAMLIYTGTRLASATEFTHAYKIGPEQLLLFIATILVTLATDLLMGVAAGLLLKIALHVKNGVPLRSRTPPFLRIISA